MMMMEQMVRRKEQTPGLSSHTGQKLLYYPLQSDLVLKGNNLDQFKVDVDES